MKNLKMFAIAVMAFAVMAMGVHATTGDYAKATCSSNCVASINGTHKYTTFADALSDAQSGDTIKLLKNVGSSELGTISNNNIAKELTINVAGYTLNLGSNKLNVDDKGTLTITGTKDGKVTNSINGGYLFEVREGGSLTTKTVTLLNNGNGGNTVYVDGGKANIGGVVTINNGAGLTRGTVVTLGAKGGEVSLNATIGTEATSFAGTLINATAVTEDSAAKVTFEGGEYYLVNSIATIKDGLSVVINGGTFEVDGSVNALIVNSGSLEIKGGSITADAGTPLLVNGGNVTVSGANTTLTSNTGAGIYTATSGEGSLTITGGKVTTGKNSTYNALHFGNGALTYAISGGEFAAGKKDVPAIWIDDSLLTGMEEDGEADHFKGMVTAGKFLYSVVGGTVDGEHNSAAVTNYIVAEGKEVTTEGDYKVVGTGTPADEPGTTEPGDTTIPPVPQTNDNILVYAGLGLVSLASVAFTAKKRED